MSNRSNPDWDQGIVGPYNCPHHLQCLSTYCTSNVIVSDSLWRFVFNKCMKLTNTSQGQHKQEISLKKIYDEVTKDIFDMSNVRFVKDIEINKWGMFLLCCVFGQLSSVKRLA